MPRNKLPEKTRQEIFAHWIQTNNYTQTAKVFHVADNTVKNVVKDMPEYYAREHENQRQQFVKEAWLVARSALREIAQRLPGADLREASVAFGIVSQRATNAMYAAQKMSSIFVQQQQVSHDRMPTADEIAHIARGVRRELELDAADPNHAEERFQRLQRLYPPPSFHG